MTEQTAIGRIDADAAGLAQTGATPGFSAGEALVQPTLNRISIHGRVAQVEFHGTFCLASVDVDGFAGQRLLLYCSLNQALELGVQEGAVLPFALRGERVRVFDDHA